MVSCPRCNDPRFSPSRLRLGTPAFPVTCKSCGGEFHGNYFWPSFVLSLLLTVGALIAALVASTLWRSSVAVLLPFALVLVIMLAALIPLSKRQIAIPTDPRTKRISRIVLWLLVLYIAFQATYDVFAA